ncbi:MAG: chloride channel protein, partial [Candidatus Thermoplasmatota archaeon]|nr:chloride channel protein [Candidatus Thermoplasmatota archaeon]
EDLADRIPLKDFVKTPLILLLIGIMLLYFPHVYGVGYDTITPVLEGKMVWYMLLLLIPIKMLATSITLAAGGSGGIFAPSLFLGAVFGGLFGSLTNSLLPDVVISSGAYAVVGMSAMVAGATHAPITAFLVIFEMTGNYKLILPLMLCSILASFVASVIKKDSIYTMKLTRRGVDLSQGMEVSIMQTTKVKDVMNRYMVVLDERMGFNDLLQKVIHSNEAYYFVTDGEGKYQGSFNVHDVKEVLSEQSLAGLVVAKDLVPISVSPCIEMNANLTQCMRKFSLYEMEELPVVDNENNNKLVGKIGRRDIINVYNREILRQGSLGLKFIKGKPSEISPAQNFVDLPDGWEINVIPVTTSMQGHTLQDLDIRHSYGVTVVAINRVGKLGEREVIIPSPDEVLKKEDMLVMMGEGDALKNLKDVFGRGDVVEK